MDELLEVGYGRLTTSNVAHRAGVSRGAQQNYFPDRESLVAEAVSRLAERQISRFKERVNTIRVDRERSARALDAIFDEYSGPFFAAALELALAARTQTEIRQVVYASERSISFEVNGTAKVIFTSETLAGAGFADRWAFALATIRGTATLRLLGHPDNIVKRHWNFARARLHTDLLGEDTTANSRRLKSTNAVPVNRSKK